MATKARDIRILADDDLKVIGKMVDAIKELNAVITSLAPSMAAASHAFHQQFRDDLKASTTALYRFNRVVERIGSSPLFNVAGATAGASFTAGLNAALGAVVLPKISGGGAISASAHQAAIREMVSKVNAGLSSSELQSELETGKNLGKTFSEGIRQGLSQRQLGNVLKNAIDNLADQADADAQGERLAAAFAKGVKMGLTKGDLKAFVNAEFQRITREADMFQLRSPLGDKEQSLQLIRAFGRGLLEGMPILQDAWRRVSDFVRDVRALDTSHEAGLAVARAYGRGLVSAGALLATSLLSALRVGFRGVQAAGGLVLDFGEWVARQIGNGIRGAAHLVGEAVRWVTDRFRGDGQIDQAGTDTGKRFSNGMIQGLFGQSNELRRAGVQLIQDGFSTLAGSGIGLLIQGQGARTAIEFEEQLKLVEVFGDLTVSEVERVKQRIFSVAMETIFDPDEQAEAFLTLLKSGLTVADAEEVLKPLSDFAVASQDTLDGASEKMIQVLSSFEIPLTEIESAMNTLVGGADISITDVQSLAHAMTFVAPVASAMGVELDEVTASLALLSDRGIDATRGGTGLRAILSSLIKPTEQAQGVLNQLGITTKDTKGNFVGMSDLLTQFQVAIEELENPRTYQAMTETSRIVMETYQEIEELADGSFQIVEKTRPIIEEEMIPMFDELGNAVTRTARGLGDVEIAEMLAPLGDRVAVTALLNLIKTAEDGTLVFDEYAEKLGQARTATEVAEAISGTFKFRLDELGSAVQVLNIQAFTPFLNDVISPFVVGLTDMVSALARLNPEVLKVGLTLFAGASALAGLFAVLQIGVGTMAVLGAGMATFGTILSSPLLLIGGALAGVGLLFVDFEQAWNGLTTGLDAGADVVMRVADRIGDAFDRLLGVRDVLRETVGAVEMYVSGTSVERDVFEMSSNQDVILGLMAERDALLRNVVQPEGDYLIKPGDTLSGIATELGMSVDELMRLNQLTDPSRIAAGAMLRTQGGLIGEEALTRVQEIEAIVKDLPFFGSKKVGTETITGLTRLERVAQRLGVAFEDLRLVAEYMNAIPFVFSYVPSADANEILSMLGTSPIKYIGQMINVRIEEAVEGMDLGLPFAEAIIGGIRNLGAASAEDLTDAVRRALEWIGAAFRLVMFTISPITTLGSLLVQQMFGGMRDDLARIADEVVASGLFDKIKTSLYTIFEEQTGRAGVSTLEAYLRVLDAIVGGNYGQAVQRLGTAIRVSFLQIGEMLSPSVPLGINPADRKFYENAQNPLISAVGGMIDDVTGWIREEAPTRLAVFAGALLAEFTRAVGAVFNYASANQFFVPQLLEFVDTALDSMAVGLQGDSADRKFTGAQTENGFTMLFKGLLENTGAWLAGDGAVLFGNLVGAAFAILGDVVTASGQTLFEDADWEGFAHQFMDSFGQGFADGALSWWDQNEVILPVGMGFHLRLSGQGTELVRLGDMARDVVQNSEELVMGIHQAGMTMEDIPINMATDIAVNVNKISLLYEQAETALPSDLLDLTRVLGATSELDLVDGQLQFTQDTSVLVPMALLVEDMDEATRLEFGDDLKKIGAFIATGVNDGAVGTPLDVMGKHMLDELRSSLGIESPSTEGIIIGGFLADGVQLGFTNKFIDWDVNDIIFGQYALVGEGVAGDVAADEGVTTPFSGILADVNRYVYEGVPSILLAHETMRTDLALLEGSFSTLGAVASGAVDMVYGKVSALGGRVVITTNQVTGLGSAFSTAGTLATTGTNAMIIAMDTLYLKLKLIAPLAEAITKMFSVAGQPIGGTGGNIPGRYAGGTVNAGTLAEVAETRRGVGFEILESGGRSYLYGNADVNVVSPYAASAMDQYRSVGTESVTYGGDTSVNIVVNADGGISSGDYNGLARDVADLVMSRVNRQTYGRRGLSAL